INDARRLRSSIASVGKPRDEIGRLPPLSVLHCQPPRHAFGNGSYRRPLATGMASRASSALGSVVPGANVMAPAFSGAWGCPRFSSLPPPPPDGLTEPTIACPPVWTCAGVDVHMLDG